MAVLSLVAFLALSDTALPQAIPANVKTAIAASVRASNSPSKTVPPDKKGGFHEEGGIWGTRQDGTVAVYPAKPGPRCPPPPPGTTGKCELATGDSVDPTGPDLLKSIDGGWHVHPKGGGSQHFVQPPSPEDMDDAVLPLNVVVAVESRTVYFYDRTGIRKEISLADFLEP